MPSFLTFVPHLSVPNDFVDAPLSVLFHMQILRWGSKWRWSVGKRSMKYPVPQKPQKCGEKKSFCSEKVVFSSHGDSNSSNEWGVLSAYQIQQGNRSPEATKTPLFRYFLPHFWSFWGTGNFLLFPFSIVGGGEKSEDDDLYLRL